MQKKTTVKEVDGSDGRIRLNLWIPDYKPVEFNITINNIIGNTNIITREPGRLISVIKQALQKEYGNVS